jgi:integrase
LRTIYNIAIDQGIVDAKLYPFGKRKYKVPAPRNTKKALSKTELKWIFNYEPQGKEPWERKALDYWKFSYLCNGANPADIFRLKHEDISKEQISFIREKTKRTTVQDLKNIYASRNEEIDGIIERQGQKMGSAYVFPILTGDEAEDVAVAKVKQAIKNCNKWMNRIGTSLGITHRITFMTARHSFATMLKRGEAPAEFISESLGHKSLATTENYMDSFESETKRKYAGLLTQFD